MTEMHHSSSPLSLQLIDSTNGRMEYQLEDKLSPWSAHEFRVQAVNILGEGQYSRASPQVGVCASACVCVCVCVLSTMKCNIKMLTCIYNVCVI